MPPSAHIVPWLPVLLGLLLWVSPASVFAQTNPETPSTDADSTGAKPPGFDTIEAAKTLARREMSDARFVAMGSAEQAALYQGDTGADDFDFVIDFEGNSLVPSVALLRNIKLPEGAKLDNDTARRVQAQIVGAYHRAGWTLARVAAVITDDKLVVYIAEGHISNVIILGASEFTTLNMRYELRIPGDIYNRFQIEREVQRLKKKYGFFSMEAKIIEKEKSSSGVLMTLGGVAPGIDGAASVQEGIEDLSGRYELRIHCKSKKKDVSFSYGLSVRPPFGLDLYTRYRHKSFLLEKDAFAASATISGGVDSGFTRARGAVSWSLPPLFVDWLIPNFSVTSQLTSLSRSDLFLDHYSFFEGSVTGRLGFKLSENSLLSAGAGYRYDNVFRLEPTAETPKFVQPVQRHFGLGILSFNMKFPDEELRTDKTHYLNIVAVSYNLINIDEPIKTVLKYRKAFFLGYNELILHARSVLLLGDNFEWQDEGTIGSNIIKVVAGDNNFTPRTIQLGFETRIAVYKDAIKVNLFAGGAGYTDLGPDDANSDPAFTAAFGPGGSLLLMDAFAFDIYYAIGINDSGETKTKIVFDLNKVF